MDLLPSAEQEEIAASVAAFLSREIPAPPRFDTGVGPVPLDDALWHRIADLGWFGLGLGEQFGGVGYGAAEEVLMFRELGRVLLPGPFLATCLGARVAALGGADELAASILRGDSRVGLGRRVETTGDDGSLRGDIVVFDGVDAPHVLIIDAARASMFRRSDVVASRTISCMDATVSLERVTFDGAGAVVSIPSTLDPIGSRSRILAAAFATGMAEAARDLSAAYAIARVQFGRPIGVNQGVKHRCADMAVRSEAAFSLACFAALVLDTGGHDAAMQADAAFAVAIDAAIRNSADTVQVHGGMGFTWEHGAHRFVTRSHVLDEMLGGSRTVLADLIGREGPEL